MSPTLIGVDELKSRPGSAAVADEHRAGVEAVLRTACDADVDAIHRLVSTHMTEGRLLPRTREEIAARIARFIVAVDNGRVVGCADLAPLSRKAAEVRSLVVAGGVRAGGHGRRPVRAHQQRPHAAELE